MDWNGLNADPKLVHCINFVYVFINNFEHLGTDKIGYLWSCFDCWQILHFYNNLFAISEKKNTFYYIYMFYHVPAFLKFASPWPLYHTIHINLTILIHAEQDCTIDHSWIRCRRSQNPNNISTSYEIWQSNTTTSCVWKCDDTFLCKVNLLIWGRGYEK